MKYSFLDNSFPINWPAFDINTIIEDVELAIKKAQSKISEICATENPTFENVLLKLENSLAELNFTWNKIEHLNHTCQSQEFRDIYNECLPKAIEFNSSIYLNKDLWNVILKFSKTQEAKQLTGIKKRFLDELLKDFIISGIYLPQDQKIVLKKIEKKLAVLEQNFSENVLDSTHAWEKIIYDENLLKGMSEETKNELQKDALEHGFGSIEKPVWRISLMDSSFSQCLRFLENEELRKELWDANMAVGIQPPNDNTQIILEILFLRKQKANILGEKNFSDLVLKRRMAKTGRNALNFINSLIEKVLPFARKEIAELEEFKAKTLGTQVDRLEPWEFDFWTAKHQKTFYSYDSEKIRSYFELSSVIKGAFLVAEKVFDIKIIERETSNVLGDSKNKIPTWDENVKYYDAYNLEDNRFLGSFYIDLYEREKKESGAWVFSLYFGERREDIENNKREGHIGIICTNFHNSSEENQHVLLTHSNVSTFFHEFGHILHHICSEVEIKSLGGLQVALDFVEFPSNFYTNWIWEKEILNLFARHYKTGELMSDDLMESLLRSKNHLTSIKFLKYIVFAKMDLELHLMDSNELSSDNLEEISQEILKDYFSHFKSAQQSIVCRFIHVFGGDYASAYYSYIWSEVISADVFTRFQENGILDKKTGKSFLKTILSKGNSKEPEELFFDFMGRNLDETAILKQKNLV